MICSKVTFLFSSLTFTSSQMSFIYCLSSICSPVKFSSSSSYASGFSSGSVSGFIVRFEMFRSSSIFTRPNLSLSIIEQTLYKSFLLIETPTNSFKFKNSWKVKPPYCSKSWSLNNLSNGKSFLSIISLNCIIQSVRIMRSQLCSVSKV